VSDVRNILPVCTLHILPVLFRISLTSWDVFVKLFGSVGLWLKCGKSWSPDKYRICQF
jgi:hypothetical protein